MKNNLIFFVAIVLAALAAIWTYWQANIASDSVRSAATRLERCQVLMQEIEFLQTRNETAVAVAPIGFDPSKFVTQAARNANLPTTNYFVNQTRLRSIEGTGAREWKIEVPQSKTSLPQVVSMIRNLAESEMRYQVNSIKLTAASDEGKIPETWNIDLDITYLKSDPN